MNVFYRVRQRKRPTCGQICKGDSYKALIVTEKNEHYATLCKVSIAIHLSFEKIMN